jgi:asparagine synthase (glutamine-hydrolysing)
MCGIAGGWLPGGIPSQIIENALTAIRHRGPDDSGVLEAGNAVLGMRRLSIIDLAGGHQPIYNEDRSVGVLFNGEIYNYLELIPPLEAKGHVFESKSDTEVLVHLYEEYGVEMCQFLRGMYAFAIWDERNQRIYIARDRFGKKPVYYCTPRSGGFIYGSEIKALRPLMTAADEPLIIREQGIYDYLSLGTVAQPETIYENVRMLPPASWMTFDGEKLNIQRYWELGGEVNSEISYDEALRQTRDQISEAVKIRLRSDVPLGVLLSGGIDSSIVAYEAARHVGTTLQTFTVSTDDAKFDESSVAINTAQMLGVKNTVLPLKVDPLETLQMVVRQYDQPFADPSAIPSLAISRLARQHVTVVLNGDGGDEIFAGYRRYLAAAYSDRFDWIPQTVTETAANVLGRFAKERRSKLGFAARFTRNLSTPPGERYLIRTTDMLRESDKHEVWRGGSMRPTEALIETILPKAASSLQTQLTGDRQIILLSLLLVKMDIASMAASLEARSPFLDHVLAEFAATLPDDYLLNGRTTKPILRDAYQGLLSEEVLKGAKKGFEIPLDNWLKNELRPMTMDLLGQHSARVRRYVADDYVDALIQGQTMQDRNWGYLVYSLLLLELWLREERA